MKVNRETFLSRLEQVKAGLSPREFIEQSSCFVFQDGMVMTFNDEVACRMVLEDLDVTGAVPAASLLEILAKIDDPDLLVRENEQGQLEFKGKNKQFGVVKDTEIFLPISRVEMPEKWRKLPEHFNQCVKSIIHCVSTDESRFILTCVHLTSEYIEACDNKKVMRCMIETGLQDDVLIRGSSLQHIIALGMNRIALTDNWVHFKNEKGLVFSCRKYSDTYPPLDDILKGKGRPITLPKTIAAAAERAAVFAIDKSGDPLVAVRLRSVDGQGVLQIQGDGLSGYYKEKKSVTYDGPPIEFLVPPELLKEVVERYNTAEITDDRLKASGDDDGQSWTFVTVLGRAHDEEDEEPAEEEDDEPKPRKAPAKKSTPQEED